MTAGVGTGVGGNRTTRGPYEVVSFKEGFLFDWWLSFSCHGDTWMTYALRIGGPQVLTG